METVLANGIDVTFLLIGGYDEFKFVVENNLFSSHMHTSLRQPFEFTARFAEANDIDYRIIDGNDVVAVYEASKELISDARSTKKPKLIEAITYRQYGHVDWRKDIDVGVNRSEKDLEAWEKRDPILRLSEALIASDLLSHSELDKIMKDNKSNIDSCWEKALDDPYPSEEELTKYVYSD
jgi:pyruvate dehydrogenase E1 component alpha subunit